MNCPKKHRRANGFIIASHKTNDVWKNGHETRNGRNFPSESKEDENYEKGFKNHNLISSLKNDKFHVSVYADITRARTRTCSNETDGVVDLEGNTDMTEREDKAGEKFGKMRNTPYGRYCGISRYWQNLSQLKKKVVIKLTIVMDVMVSKRPK